MNRAWEIFRNLEGDRVAKLKQALKQAWAEYKNTIDVKSAKTVKMYGYFTTEGGAFINSWLELPVDYTMLNVIRECQYRGFKQFMLVETMNKMVNVPNI